MKVFDRFVIVLVTLCFFVLAIGLAVLPPAGSIDYYLSHYDHDVSERTGFTKTELTDITQRMIDYLFEKRPDMQYFSESIQADVFSDDAIEHMADVRILFHGGRIIVWIAALLFVSGAVYLFFRFKHIKKILLKYSVLTLAGIALLLAGLFGFITVAWLRSNNGYFETAFDIFHRLIFPDPAKYGQATGFRSDDNLILILSGRFFLNFAIRIGVVFAGIIVSGYALLISGHYLIFKGGRNARINRNTGIS